MIDLWESLIQTLSALAIVMVLMGLLVLAAKRVLGPRIGLVGPRPLVQVLASGYVGPRKTIALVSVAGEYLIVGTTATDLVPLGRIRNRQQVDELLAASPAALSPPAASGFNLSSWLQQVAVRFKPQPKGHHDAS